MSVTTPVHNPLFLEGWLQFNAKRWGVTPIRRHYGADPGASPRLETVYYLDKRGRIQGVPRTPYTAMAFVPTKTLSFSRLYRQWLEVAEPCAEDMRRLGLRAAIALPPEVRDVRPWTWSGFRVGVRYTLRHDLQADLDEAEPAVRKNLRKSLEAGYYVRQTADLAALHECLSATEARQGFSHELSVSQLEDACTLLGEENFRTYVCYAPNGKAASARVVLHSRGATAIDWVAGTTSAHLKSGATQLLIDHVLRDLARSGAAGFDFAGADRANIALAKVAWGGALVPYFTIEAANTRLLFKTLRDVVTAKRK